MDQRILDYLAREKVCSLTTTLKDGSPHAAALHFSHQPEPLELYFSTENTSKKCEGLLNDETVRGSVVLGFSEIEWITLQMDGNVVLVKDPNELTKIKAVHYPKHPKSQEFEKNPETVFLKFVPTWYRYTDYNTKPPTFISSENG